MSWFFSAIFLPEEYFTYDIDETFNFLGFELVGWWLGFYFLYSFDSISIRGELIWLSILDIDLLFSFLTTPKCECFDR